MYVYTLTWYTYLATYLRVLKRICYTFDIIRARFLLSLHGAMQFKLLGVIDSQRAETCQNLQTTPFVPISAETSSSKFGCHLEEGFSIITVHDFL